MTKIEKKLNPVQIQNWQWRGFLILLVLAPINSKIAGACWLAFCILGLLSIKNGFAKGPTEEFSSAKVLVFTCLMALALRAVTQFYWGDSWGERHAEFRLLFGAIGLLGLVHYASFTSDQLKFLGYALVLASWAGFGLMLIFGVNFSPTNQIPYGASMSMLVCVVLALTLSASSQSLLIRLFYASGTVAGVCAVLLSQARGSYGILFWVGGVLLWKFARGDIEWKKAVSNIFMAVILTVLLLRVYPQLVSIPIERILQAVTEYSAIDGFNEQSVNTSVGARLYLWSRAMDVIPENLLMGNGREARMAFIQLWGSEINVPEISALGHLHNNYLAELFDQGLIGLGSFLSFFIGLFCMVVCLRKYKPMAALGISGILFMHATSSLTNVNFAHNYYPTILSVAVSVCLLLFMRSSDSGGDTL